MPTASGATSMGTGIEYLKDAQVPPAAAPAPLADPPRLAARRIALAQPADQLDDLGVAQGLVEGGHEAQLGGGGLAHTVQQGAQQVVGPLAVQLAAQGQGHVGAEQARAVAVVVASGAGA